MAGWKMILTFWDGLISGAMLNFGRVLGCSQEHVEQLQLPRENGFK